MQTKALFLDRDGVVNVDHGYVSKPEQFEFIDGVFEATKWFQQQGFEIVIVTNQSGIGRGYYDEKTFNELTRWMKGEFAKHEVQIADVQFCPHHPTNAQPEYLKACDCRKPEPESCVPRGSSTVDYPLDLGHWIPYESKDAGEPGYIANRNAETPCRQDIPTSISA